MPASITESTIVGYVLAALVLVIGFAATVLKLNKPLQELNSNIVKLTTIVQFLVQEQKELKQRVSNHGHELDKLNIIVTQLQTEVEHLKKEDSPRGHYQT